MLGHIKLPLLSRTQQHPDSTFTAGLTLTAPLAGTALHAMLAVLGRRTSQAVLPALAVGARQISTTTAAADLRDFMDTQHADHATYGRAWLARELRNKSFDDLHKLWVICLKERNMLLTKLRWARTQENKSKVLDQDKDKIIERYTMTKKTMSRIKQVLSERANHEADAVKAAEMKKVIHYM